MDVGELVDDGLVGVGVAPLEGQLLELLAHGLHAHAAGQRRIDLERLLGDAPAALRLHVLERAHVVQAVGQLDQQHADVAGDGDQELAEVLRLLGLLGDEVELLDLGQAVDQVADLLAELLVDLGARDVGVLDHVVQQRRDDGGIVELELGQDGRDFEGMGEVGIAGGALLVAVRLHGVDVGAVEQRLVGAGVVFLDPLDQLVLAHHATPRRIRLAPASALYAFARPTPATCSVASAAQDATTSSRLERQRSAGAAAAAAVGGRLGRRQAFHAAAAAAPR